MNRYLTTSERFFLHVADQIVTNNVMLIRCRGVLPEDRIRTALDEVQRRHPALRVRVVRGQRPWFSAHAVGTIPLHVVERRDAEHWREVVRSEQNTPVEIEAGPLLRFTLVRDAHACELICTADHLNSDGYSLLALFRDLLAVVEDPQRRLVPLRERTSFEDYLPKGPFERNLVPAPYKNLLADATQRIGQRWARREGAPTPPARPAQVEFIDRQFGRERSEALLAACRGQGATVHNALMVACAHALAQTRRKARRRGASLVACTSPINIRSMLDPPVGDDYGLYAWSPTTVQRIKPAAEFWALARRSQQQLSNYRKPATLAAMRGVRDLAEIAEGLVRDPTASSKAARGFFDGTLIASNLGRVNLAEQVAGVEITGFDVFAIVPNVDCLMIVYSFRGQLCFCYCCSPQWAGPGVISRVADGVEAVIDAVLGHGVRGVARGLRYAPLGLPGPAAVRHPG